MKTTLTFVLFMGFILLHGQDIILKTSGEKIECRIIEVTEKKMTYIKYGSEPSDVFTIKRTQIDTIFYMESSCQIDIPPTDSTFTDSRDGYTYPLFRSGDQIWFAENLRFDTIGSTTLPEHESYEEIYGRLYTFKVAQKACPCGWHLPSDSEWKVLERELGMVKGVDSDGWRGNGIGQGNLLKPGYGTNFNALFGGAILEGDSWFLLQRALFWTNTVCDTYPSEAWTREIGKRASILRAPKQQNSMLSVRCIKNP